MKMQVNYTLSVRQRNLEEKAKKSRRKDKNLEEKAKN